MTLQLKYGDNFDDAWNELKEQVREQMVCEDCIDTKNNIKWPCYVYIVKREKEPMFNH